MRSMIPRPTRANRPDFSLATVNIVLLLLLYFLVAGDPASELERSMMPPQTKELPLDGLPRPLLVLHPDGSLALDGLPARTDDLRRMISAGDLPRVHLLVSETHPARAILSIAGELGPAGAEVVLVTLRPGQGVQ